VTALALSRGVTTAPPVTLARSQPSSEDLAAYLPKVETITTELWIRYVHILRGRVEWEDLYHFGVEGLMRARNQWRSGQPGTFWNYAEFVVRGYIFDSIRGDHIIPMQRPDRIDRRNGKLLRGRIKPRLESLPDYDYSEFARYDKYKDPLLRNLIYRLLTQREIMLIQMHFFEDATLTQVGDVFGVGEARMSQILKDVLRRLRAAIAYHATIGD